MGLHDCQHQAVVAVIATPAVVHFLRAPVIQATVKQVRYEPHVTVAIIRPLLGNNELLTNK